MSELRTVVDGIDPKAFAPRFAWALAHCAQSIEYSLTGYPKLRSGLFRATIGPLAKRKFIRANRMSHDVSAPVPGAPVLDGDDVAAAKARLVAAVATLAFDPSGAIRAVTRNGTLVAQVGNHTAIAIDHGVHAGAAVGSDRLAIALDDGPVFIAPLAERSFAELAPALARATTYAP